MKHDELDFYTCPVSSSNLTLVSLEEANNEVVSGVLQSSIALDFPITNGVPDLIYPRDLTARDAHARSFYDDRAEAYDKYLYLTFKTHGEDEQKVRNNFIDAMNLQPTSRVLEVACGTGRDSNIIASRLGPKGIFCMQDISRAMLERCQRRLSNYSLRKSFCLSNACYLPYPNNYFDAVYSFGALGEFSDIKRSLAEMVRVCKVGAKIVVGDEGMPPWLRETEFCNILITTNKQFLAEVPLKDMPVQARDVCLRWVIGGVFYLIEFRVGNGEPKGDFDIEIPGIRGGTLRTRYLGQLEGVTVETKGLAARAREKRGISMHAWLDTVVRQAALRDLEQ